jgi:hypothetical protein
MKKKYGVQTRFVFDGVFIIQAENEMQAKEYVEKHCGMVIGSIHTSLSQEDADWDFPVHPDKVVTVIRRR